MRETTSLVQTIQTVCPSYIPYTDKKKFFIYKEIQKGAVAKSYMTAGLLIQYMTKYLHISSYIMKHFLIHDFATAPI
jgi:hypothetical protein